MKQPTAWTLAVALLMGMVLVFGTGCDDTTTDNHIDIVPAQTNLVRGADPVLFTVLVDTNQPLFMPLEWTSVA